MRAASGKDTRGGDGQAPSVYRLERDTGQAERKREGGAREGEGPGGPVGRRPLIKRSQEFIKHLLAGWIDGCRMDG